MHGAIELRTYKTSDKISSPNSTPLKRKSVKARIRYFDDVPCIANRANASPTPYPMPCGCFNPSAARSCSVARTHIYESANQVRSTLLKSGVVVFRVSVLDGQKLLLFQDCEASPESSFKVPASHIRVENVCIMALNSDLSYFVFLRRLLLECSLDWLELAGKGAAVAEGSESVSLSFNSSSFPFSPSILSLSSRS